MFARRTFGFLLPALVSVTLLGALPANADQLSTEVDIDRPGGDYRNFDLPQPSFELCRDACAGEPQCMAYTYVKPGVQGPSARCWLKSSVPNPVSKKCSVSGVSEGREVYDCRWDKIGGPGGPWTTDWVPNHPTPECGHGAAGCSCGSENYCGRHRTGSVTYWWPQGCQGPKWTIQCSCRVAQSHTRYKCRWDKTGGPGGPWTTDWIPNHPTPQCGHQAAGCNCGNENYCGLHQTGAVTYWWPQGCSGPKWTIQCSCMPE